MFYDLAKKQIHNVLTLPTDPLIGYPSLTYSDSERTILFSTKEDVRSDLIELRTQN